MKLYWWHLNYQAGVKHVAVLTEDVRVNFSSVHLGYTQVNSRVLMNFWHLLPISYMVIVSRYVELSTVPDQSQASYVTPAFNGTDRCRGVQYNQSFL